MPGHLKLPTISSFGHSHKLTHGINWARRTHHAAARSRSFRHPDSAARLWLWRRIHRCAPSTHAKPHPPNCPSSLNPSPPSKYRHPHLTQFVGFPGQEFWHLSSSSSYNCHRKRRGYYCSFNSSGIATHMGHTPSDHHHGDDGKKVPPSHPDKLVTVPTILTIGRVAAVPLLVSAFYFDTWWAPNVTTGIFIAAAITDWLDGYLARKMKQGTVFGAFLDPVADKLMVAAALVLLCAKPLQAGICGQAPWLLTVPAIAIIGREITMSAVREWAASQDGKLSEAVAVNNLGKWKTATQMTALTILLATRDSSLVGSGTLVASGVVLLYISSWLSIWSLFVYVRKIWKVLIT